MRDGRLRHRPGEGGRGRGVLLPPRPGPVELRLALPGFAAESRLVELRVGERREVEIAGMPLPPATAKVRGVVLKAATRRPAPGLEVFLEVECAHYVTMRTGVDGCFEASVPRGRLRITALPPEAGAEDFTECHATTRDGEVTELEVIQPE